MCDPTIWQPGFDLPWQQWSLLNRFRTEQGHCGACRRKWRLSDTDLRPCGETQTMSHIVESCPPTQLNGGLSRLHSADEDAVLWLTNYCKWHAYEKKIAVPLGGLCVLPVRTGLRTPCPSAPAEALRPSPGLSGHVLVGIQCRRDDDVGAAEELFICLWTGASSLNNVNAWLLGLEHC